MGPWGIGCAWAVCALGTCAYAEGAYADGVGADERPWSVDLLLGYGHEFQQGVSGLGLGVGARASYTTSFGLSLGTGFVAYVGGREAAGSTYSNERRATTLGVDLGYALSLGSWFVLRPYARAGLLVDASRTTVGDAVLASTDVEGFVAPGLSALIQLGRWTVGGDISTPVYPDRLVAGLSYSTFLVLGARF